MPPLALVEHLVGLQAQEPHGPVRRPVDAHRRLRPDVAERRDRDPAGRPDRADAHDPAPRLDPRMRSGWPRSWTASCAALYRELGRSPRTLGDVDPAPIIDGRPRAADGRAADPGRRSARRLAERFPGSTPSALALLARYHLPLVQVPPRGPVAPDQPGDEHDPRGVDRARRRRPTPLEDVVRRYLRGVRAGVDRRHPDVVVADRRARGRRPHPRPRLRVYRDERGRELLDVEDGLDRRPGPAGAGPLPAPVRQRLPVPRRPLAHQRRDDLGPRLRLEGRRSSSTAASTARGGSGARRAGRRR